MSESVTNGTNDLPRMALYLGFGGILPLLALAVVIPLGYSSLDVIVFLTEVGVISSSSFNGQPYLLMSLQAWMAIYAAIILNFIGAVHWGVVIVLNDKLNTTEKNKLLIYSNFPALLAWFSFLLPMNLSLFFLAL